MKIALERTRCQNPGPEIGKDFSSGGIVCKSGSVLGDKRVDNRPQWSAVVSPGPVAEETTLGLGEVSLTGHEAKIPDKMLRPISADIIRSHKQ